MLRARASRASLERVDESGDGGVLPSVPASSATTVCWIGA